MNINGRFKIMWFFVTCVCLLLSSSCSFKYYTPNSILIPHLTKQYDTQISGGMFLGRNFIGTEIQTAYSPIRHVFLMGNFFSVVKSFGYLDTLLHTRRLIKDKKDFIELGIGGYFNPYAHVTWSGAAGYGRGGVEIRSSLYEHSKFFQERVFLQSAISVRKKIMQYGFGLRLCYLNFYKARISLSDIDKVQVDKVIRLQKDNPFWLPEYSYKLGFRFHAFTLFYELTYSPSASGHTDNRFSGSQANLFLTVDLHTLIAREKKLPSPSSN